MHVRVEYTESPAEAGGTCFREREETPATGVDRFTFQEFLQNREHDVRSFRVSLAMFTIDQKYSARPKEVDS